jgi:aspartyl-tRNA(Asn)/glutamyl-tRNA(Gln) amidotransferase subunit C
MPKTTQFTSDDVSHIATLAHIPVTDDEKKELAKGFSTVIDVVDKLAELDTKNIEPTSQVTGLTNIFREDVVSDSLSQDNALSNAKRTHNGFFVVDQVIEQTE